MKNMEHWCDRCERSVRLPHSCFIDGGVVQIANFSKLAKGEMVDILDKLRAMYPNELRKAIRSVIEELEKLESVPYGNFE